MSAFEVTCVIAGLAFVAIMILYKLYRYYLVEIELEGNRFILKYQNMIKGTKKSFDMNQHVFRLLVQEKFERSKRVIRNKVIKPKQNIAFDR